MRDFFTIGPTPREESCAYVGEPDYEEKALAQCRRFIGLLRQTFGLEPDGTRLSIKSFPHDFGTYYSVVCHFSHGIPASAAYARAAAKTTRRQPGKRSIEIPNGQPQSPHREGDEHGHP